MQKQDRFQNLTGFFHLKYIDIKPFHNLIYIKRRGSWRPIGHMRPSSPLLDSVKDNFEGREQLAEDFMRLKQIN